MNISANKYIAIGKQKDNHVYRSLYSCKSAYLNGHIFCYLDI